jgi:hypothetical protein
MLGEHLTLMRWIVTVVIAYAAIAMLRSARAMSLKNTVITAMNTRKREPPSLAGLNIGVSREELG